MHYNRIGAKILVNYLTRWRIRGANFNRNKGVIRGVIRRMLETGRE